MLRLLFIISLAFFCLNLTAQNKIDGQYDKELNAFFPDKLNLDVVRFEHSTFAEIKLGRSLGVIDKRGNLLAPIKFDKLFLIDSSTEYFIVQSREGSNRVSDFRYFLFHKDSIDKPRAVIVDFKDRYSYGSYPGNNVVIIKDSMYSVYNVMSKKIIFDPQKGYIKLVMPEGYLIAGNCDTLFSGKRHSLFRSDNRCYAYYDKNFKKKTASHLSDVIYQKRYDNYRTTSKYGKGLLSKNGNEIFKPIYDRASYLYGTRDIYKIEFAGMTDIEGIDGDGFSAKEGSKSRLYKSDGQLLLKDTFFDVRAFNALDSTIIVTRGGNRTIHIPSKDDEIVPAGLFTYVKNAKKNILHINKGYLLPTDFQYIDFVKPSIYLLEQADRNFIYNSKKNKIIPIKTIAKYMNERDGFMYFRSGEKYGLLDENGNVWRNEMFDGFNTASSYAILTKGSKKLLIDKNFKTIITAGKYDTINIMGRTGEKKYIRVGKRNKNGEFKYGVLDFETKKTLLPIIYESIVMEYDGDYPFIVSKNGKYGLCSKNNTMHLPPKYDEIRSYYEKEKLYAVKKNGMFLYIDSNKKELMYKDYFIQWPVLAPIKQLKKKDGTINFLNEKRELVFTEETKEVKKMYGTSFTIAQRNGKQGIVNNRGYVFIPFQYDSIYYKDGNFIAQSKRGNELYNLIGEKLNYPPFDKLGTKYKNGMRQFQYKGLWGMLDKNGRQLIAPNYERIDNFYDKYYQVTQNKKHFIIDSNENKITEPAQRVYRKLNNHFIYGQNKPCTYLYTLDYKPLDVGCFAYLGHPSPDIYTLQNTSRRYGQLYSVRKTDSLILIDSTGKKLHKGTFNGLRKVENKYYIAIQNGRWKLLTVDFKPKHKNDFEQIEYLNQDRFRVIKGSFMAVMNENGKLITDFDYRDIRKYTNGKAKAYGKDSKPVYLNLKGKVVKDK